jgi:GNAT domain-containint protein/N-acyltransferase family protein
MESEVLKNIFKIDKDKLLEPFIEYNFKEFSNGKWLDAGNIPLSDEWICENRKIAGVEKEAECDLLEMAKIVRNDETLKFLFFHCSNLLYGVNKLYSESIMKWPDFSPLIPEGKGSMFLLLLGFYAIDRIIAIHKTMNIPEDITFATCADVGSRVLISKDFNDGEIGISNQCINWLRNNFVAGRIFQIGRMQFHLGRPFRVYRSRSVCEYKIIAEPGLCVAPDGFLDGAGCKISDYAWETEFQLSDNQITANQVDDNTGKILKTPVTFSTDEWKIVLNADSLVMNIHIPRGSRLSTEVWFDSIARAFDFFEKCMKPKVSLDACVCFSWMFEPRLRNFLPEHSGLIALQNAVHLFPLPTTATDCGLYFVFGKHNIDIYSASTDTSLRRGIVEHLKHDGVLTGGSMVFFKDELG